MLLKAMLRVEDQQKRLEIVKELKKNNRNFKIYSEIFIMIKLKSLNGSNFEFVPEIDKYAPIYFIESSDSIFYDPQRRKKVYYPRKCIRLIKSEHNITALNMDIIIEKKERRIRVIHSHLWTKNIEDTPSEHKKLFRH